MLNGTTTVNSDSDIYYVDAITLFSFVWAAQSLAHLAFFENWINEENPLSWILLVLAFAVFVFPGRLQLFIAMAAADVAYFVSEWPFVSNHILASTFMGLAILGAAVSVLKMRTFSLEIINQRERDEIFARFAPVVGAIFAFVYYAIIVSKLNEAFFDPAVSCMEAMYSYFITRNSLFSFIGHIFDTRFLFWLFIVIEIALPVFLTFRATRLLAVYIGLPFHVLLGMMGHWSFSAMMIALYLLIAMPAVLDLLRQVLRWSGARRTSQFIWAFRGYIAFMLLLMIAGGLSGTYVDTKAPFGYRFNFAAVHWLIWAGVSSAMIGLATLRWQFLNSPFSAKGATLFWSGRPGWIWLMLFIALLNSASPYIGLKTETSIAMYSNMRTEGGENNHFFMPTLRLFDFPDDLVEVLDSNEPVIKSLRSRHALFDPYENQHDILVTAFELRRAIGQVNSPDLEITYIRDGETRQFKRGDASNPDPDLDQPPPWWLAKLVYFRPVFKGENAYCLH